MKTTCRRACYALAGLNAVSLALGGIFVDITPGTAAPPGTLGGYSMGAFPADTTDEGTLTTSLTPPAAFPGVGDLEFTTDVEHMKVGSFWATWSHGYTGSVYFNDDRDLLMLTPTDTLAFYLYIQPNIMETFEFFVFSGDAFVSVEIDGTASARYVGFYTDDPLDALQFVYVREITGGAEGFAVGEFGINVPEPASAAAFAALGLLGFAAWRRHGAR